jgi:hypothetical protein
MKYRIIIETEGKDIFHYPQVKRNWITAWKNLIAFKKNDFVDDSDITAIGFKRINDAVLLIQRHKAQQRNRLKTII